MVDVAPVLDASAQPRPSSRPTSESSDRGSPRARMAAALSASLAEAMDVGDIEAARIAHEAIGRLLREGASGDGGEVVDLARRRTTK